MPISIKPEAIRNGGKYAGSGLGGGLIAIIILYLLNQLDLGSNSHPPMQPVQAVIDAKQDARIEQNTKDIIEGKRDRKRILRVTTKMDRRLIRIATKLKLKPLEEERDLDP